MGNSWDSFNCSEFALLQGMPLPLLWSLYTPQSKVYELKMLRVYQGWILLTVYTRHYMRSQDWVPDQSDWCLENEVLKRSLSRPGIFGTFWLLGQRLNLHIKRLSFTMKHKFWNFSSEDWALGCLMCKAPMPKLSPMGHWGQATLRAATLSPRLWGQTTLRADDFEGRRLWGQTTLRADDFEGRYSVH